MRKHDRPVEDGTSSTHNHLLSCATSRASRRSSRRSRRAPAPATSSRRSRARSSSSTCSRARSSSRSARRRTARGRRRAHVPALEAAHWRNASEDEAAARALALRPESVLAERSGSRFERAPRRRARRGRPTTSRPRRVPRQHRGDVDAARPEDEPRVVARRRCSSPPCAGQRTAGEEAAELAAVGHVRQQPEEVARLRGARRRARERPLPPAARWTAGRGRARSQAVVYFPTPKARLRSTRIGIGRCE